MSDDAKSARESMEKSRIDVMECEEEIKSIKTALRSIAMGGESSRNRLEVSVRKVQAAEGGDGDADDAPATFQINLSSPIEERTITKLHDPLDPAAEGSLGRFESVETSNALITVEAFSGGDPPRKVGESAPHDLLPLCQDMELWRKGGEKKTSTLEIAIVAEKGMDDVESTDKDGKEEAPVVEAEDGEEDVEYVGEVRENEEPNVTISLIHYDGEAYRTEKDEYVKISNTGGPDADISGWRISADDKGQDFVFPAGTILEAGKDFRVYTNEDHPESGGFKFGSGRAIWNNKGDAVHLFGADGRKVSTCRYGSPPESEPAEPPVAGKHVREVKERDDSSEEWEDAVAEEVNEGGETEDSTKEERAPESNEVKDEKEETPTPDDAEEPNEPAAQDDGKSTGLQLPAYTLTIQLEYTPSADDRRDALYDKLNEVSKRKVAAIESLRKSAGIVNRAAAAEAPAKTGGEGKNPAVKTGFLNKPKAKEEKPPPFWKRWYGKTLGPNSLLWVVGPVAKNYVIFAGVSLFIHFKGDLLALPPPV